MLFTLVFCIFMKISIQNYKKNIFLWNGHFLNYTSDKESYKFSEIFLACVPFSATFPMCVCVWVEGWGAGQSYDARQ